MTNFEKMTSSPEALAEAMVFETIKGIWRYGIGEKISVQDIGDAETRLRALVELEVTPFAQPFRDFTGSAATSKEQRDFARFANIKGGKLALKMSFKEYYH